MNAFEGALLCDAIDEYNDSNLPKGMILGLFRK